jgi:hypothetical protein
MTTPVRSRLKVTCFGASECGNAIKIFFGGNS